MEFNDIMALVRAGYTAQQIEDMRSTLTVDKPEQKVEETPEVVEEKTVPNQPDYTDLLNQLSDKISNVEKNVQKQNIIKEEMPIEPHETFMDNMNELLKLF